MTVAEESQAYQREDGMLVIPRTEFCRDYFDYKAGEHVTFGGPTQRGKTTLAFNLLEYTATPELPVYVAVSKPFDPTTANEGERLGFRNGPLRNGSRILWGKSPGAIWCGLRSVTWTPT